MRYLLFGFVICLANCSPAPSETSTSDVEKAAQDAAIGAEAAADAAADATAGDPTGAKAGWTYDEKVDEMRGATSKMAMLSATAPLRLNFPYGESFPELIVRQDPKYGFDVLFRINGQFMCNGFSNTTFSAKFDDGAVKSWGCAGADGGANDVLFVTNDRAFLRELKASTKLIIEAEIYDAGRQQMKFDVAGLKWD